MRMSEGAINPILHFDCDLEEGRAWHKERDVAHDDDGENDDDDESFSIVISPTDAQWNNRVTLFQELKSGQI